MSGLPAKTRRKSLFVSTVALIALVCLALVAFDTWRTMQAYDSQLREARKNTDNLVRSLAEHVGDSIQVVDALLIDMRQRLENRTNSPDQIVHLHDAMMAQVEQSRVIHAFFLFNADGSVLTSTVAPTDPPQNNSDRDFFTYWRTHTDNHPFIGGPYRSRVGGTWVITISRRLNNPDGSLRAIAVGVIALDLFSKYYESFDIGAGGLLMLLTDDGTIMVRRPAETSFYGKKLPDPWRLFGDFGHAETGHFDAVSQIDGVPRLGSFRRVPGLPLTVVAGLDRTEVMAEWRAEARAHAAGVILLVVVIVLLGLRLTSQIATEVRLSDERLRRSEKMEVIGRLAAGVAHDFNNILQVIMGGMEILRDETNLSPQGQAFITEVENAAGRGSSLTHHLLAYSRKQVLSPQLLDVAEIFESLRIVLSRTLPSRVAVTIEVAPGTGLIRADPNLLQTALMNLAINAAHAMAEGGTLRCEARTAETGQFGELRPGRHVVLAVSDTGPGMSAEVMSQAFDPFFTTKGLEGSGLGLPMVQGFSRQSGGDVRILSVPGEGTTVEIWLPEVAAPRKVATPQKAASPQSGTVLLVDDSRDVLVMVDAFLRKGGFAVRQAGNGYEALAALAAGEKFDLLVTDYMMPGLDGLGLIRQARNFRPGLPALIISGYAETNEELLDLPDTAFLTKPFQRDNFLAQVGALIGAAQARMSETTE